MYADKIIDEVIDIIDIINNFLKQGLSEKDDIKTMIGKMEEAVWL